MQTYELIQNYLLQSEIKCDCVRLLSEEETCPPFNFKRLNL